MRSSVAAGYVLRGHDQAGRVRPARMSADLATTPFTALGVADPRLVDPHMEEVVEEAKAAAREAGYADGHAEGYEAGRREGLDLLAAQQAAFVEKDAAERAARKERLVQLLGSVESAVVAALDYQAPRVEEMRHLIATMAVDIAEELVGHHLEVGDCAAEDAVRRALSMVPRHASVSMRMHPDDIAAVTEFTDGLSEWTVARMVPDPTVAHGDAYAESENLEVEASIAGGLERMRAVLNP